MFEKEKTETKYTSHLLSLAVEQLPISPSKVECIKYFKFLIYETGNTSWKQAIQIYLNKITWKQSKRLHV